jgi:phospholipid transport system substrate-binding protein
VEFHWDDFCTGKRCGIWTAREEAKMTTITKAIAGVGLSAFLTGTPVNSLGAASPGEQVQVTANRVLEILNDPKLKGEANLKGRRQQLRETILPRFDFAEMSKRALGKHWARYPDQQKEFVTAFAQLLEDTYVVQVEGAAGDKMVVVNERTQGDVAEVNTKIISPKGEEMLVAYRLHKDGPEWKVYDVIVENVSLVNNYRSQFNRILANNSMDELIKRIKDKQLAQRG